MQLFLIHFFLFTTTFSCGFAQEKSLRHDLEDIIPLAANVDSYTEENPAPYSEDRDIAAVNVEEILRELSAERAKNRDLNQTISDILDEMKDMEKNIMRNEEKIIDNQSSVFLLTRDVEDLQDDVVTVAGDVERNSANITKVFEDVASVQEDVAAVHNEVIIVAEDVEKNEANITIVFEDVDSLTNSYQQQAIQIDLLTSSDHHQDSLIQSLGMRGTWCGHQDIWTTDNSIITYDKLTLSDTNMNFTGTPLDINTGTVASIIIYLLSGF